MKALTPLAKSMAILVSFSFLVSLSPATSSASAPTTPQFEHTGNAFADLVVGVPLEDLPVGGYPVGDVGAIQVIYGFPQGLSAQDNEIWHQSMPSSQDQAEAGDQFGNAIASGDFNGDGYYDLAVGVPFENLPGETSAGAVHIIYSSGDGVLTSVGNQFITQDTADVVGDADFGDQFGKSLAVGDFNGDDYDDLAIGVPYEDFEGTPTISNAGVVNVIYGSSNGLDPDGVVDNQMWHQDRVDIIDNVEDGDWFGYALASGDFDSDGYDDLAVGAPGESSTTKTGIGVVHIIYGTSLGLTAADNQQWEQYDWGYGTESESLDHFGASLAAGNYNGEHEFFDYDDLAIGVPDENLELAGGTVTDAGAVNVLFGASSGLSMSDVVFLYQDGETMYDEDAESYDHFGYTLVSRADDHSEDDFLVVGCPYEDKGPGANPEVYNAGAVYILSYTGTKFDEIHQLYQGKIPQNVPDEPESGDRFGYSLAVGDFDGNGMQDLAIGIPYNEHSASGDGAVVVAMFYRPIIFEEYTATIWYQGVNGLVDSGETDDGFGLALAAIPSSGPLPFRIYLPITMKNY